MRWILACALVAFDLQLQLNTGWRFGSVASPVWKKFIGQKKPARNRDNRGSLPCCHACLGLIFRGNATPNTGAVACFSHLWWNRVNCDIYECRYTIFVGVSSILKQYVYIYTWLYIYTQIWWYEYLLWYIMHCNDIVVLHRCPSTHYIRWPSLCREDSGRHILILSHSKP